MRWLYPYSKVCSRSPVKSTDQQVSLISLSNGLGDLKPSDNRNIPISQWVHHVETFLDVLYILCNQFWADISLNSGLEGFSFSWWHSHLVNICLGATTVSLATSKTCLRWKIGRSDNKWQTKFLATVVQNRCSTRKLGKDIDLQL